MISESLRKQQRAIRLSTRKRILSQTLSDKEESELRILNRESSRRIKKILINTEKMIKAAKAHQKRTKDLNVGTYGSYTQAA